MPIKKNKTKVKAVKNEGLNPIPGKEEKFYDDNVVQVIISIENPETNEREIIEGRMAFVDSDKRLIRVYDEHDRQKHVLVLSSNNYANVQFVYKDDNEKLIEGLEKGGSL